MVLVALIGAVDGIGIVPMGGGEGGIGSLWLLCLGMGGFCRLFEESKLLPERCLLQLLRLKQGIQEQQRVDLELGFHDEPPAILNLVAGRRSKLTDQRQNASYLIQGAERENRLTWR